MPKRFVSAVFLAARSRVVTVGQAKALCDLYHAQYDLVMAAWEVYLREGDSRDLIDTLRRIVRDLTFDEGGNIAFTSPGQDSDLGTDTEPKAVTVPLETAVEKTMHARSEMEADAAAKTKAVAAVANAKQDLLRHSLDMMVKQNVTTQEGADAVWKRALKGDALVDAAIEQYANDRDVGEFLETLQLLAALSPEDIDALIRNAADSLDENDIKDEAEEDGGDDGDDSDDDNDEKDDDDDSEDGEEEDKKKSVDGTTTQTASETDFPRQALAELYRQGFFSTKHYQILMALLAESNSRLLAAFDVFKEVQDAEDLVDSLKRIARYAAELSGEDSDEDDQPSSPAAVAPAPEDDDDTDQENEKDNHEDNSEDREDSEDSEEDEEGIEPAVTMTSTGVPADEGPVPVLPPDDQKRVVQILAGAGAFTSDQQDYLDELIESRSRVVRSLFKAYEDKRDVNSLIRGLFEALPASLKGPAQQAAAEATVDAQTHRDGKRSS